jgi:8-oxo-dGTP pyrophosphatase MutT (NUDIX family)
LTGRNGAAYNELRSNPTRHEKLQARSFQRDTWAVMADVETSRVETLVSSGGVVFRKIDGRLETVLCGRSDPVRWSLAKGTPDPGETLEETALREVREETGLEVELNAPLGSIEYWFADRDNDVRYHKTVHFYLMSPVGGHIDQHDPEFDVVQWFEIDEALSSMAYGNEAGVLRRAVDVFKSREGQGQNG